MKLDLSEILARPGMRYVYPVEEPPLVDEELECADLVRGELVFTNTGNVLLMSGTVDARLVLPCSRCLAYYEEPVSAKVEEGFPLEIKPLAGRGRQPIIEVQEEEASIEAGKLFEGHLLDLTELIRQNLMLELPSRPLHAPDCRGLCPTCGTNLNEGTCTCAETDVSRPLTKLAQLLANENDRSTGP